MAQVECMMPTHHTPSPTLAGAHFHRRSSLKSSGNVSTGNLEQRRGSTQLRRMSREEKGESNVDTSRPTSKDVRQHERTVVPEQGSGFGYQIDRARGPISEGYRHASETLSQQGPFESSGVIENNGHRIDQRSTTTQTQSHGQGQGQEPLSTSSSRPVSPRTRINLSSRRISSPDLSSHTPFQHHSFPTPRTQRSTGIEESRYGSTRHPNPPTPITASNFRQIPESQLVDIHNRRQSMPPMWRRTSDTQQSHHSLSHHQEYYDHSSTMDIPPQSGPSSSHSFSSSRSSLKHPFHQTTASSARAASPPPSFSLSSGKPLVQPPAKTQAAFVGKLYAMLEDEEISKTGLIQWSPDGTLFSCPNPTEFSKIVLPRFFKHNNWQSFVRQLNMYSFNKVSRVDRDGRAYRTIGDSDQMSDLFASGSEPGAWDFKHPLFRRGEPQLLAQIKRKPTRPTAAESGPTSPNDEMDIAKSSAVAGWMRETSQSQHLPLSHVQRPPGSRSSDINLPPHVGPPILGPIYGYNPQTGEPITTRPNERVISRDFSWDQQHAAQHRMQSQSSQTPSGFKMQPPERIAIPPSAPRFHPDASRPPLSGRVTTPRESHTEGYLESPYYPQPTSAVSVVDILNDRVSTLEDKLMRTTETLNNERVESVRDKLDLTSYMLQVAEWLGSGHPPQEAELNALRQSLTRSGVELRQRYESLMAAAAQARIGTPAGPRRSMSYRSEGGEYHHPLHLQEAATPRSPPLGRPPVEFSRRDIPLPPPPVAPHFPGTGGHSLFPMMTAAVARPATSGGQRLPRPTERDANRPSTTPQLSYHSPSERTPRNTVGDLSLPPLQGQHDSPARQPAREEHEVEVPPKKRSRHDGEGSSYSRRSSLSSHSGSGDDEPMIVEEQEEGAKVEALDPQESQETLMEESPRKSTALSSLLN